MLTATQSYKRFLTMALYPGLFFLCALFLTHCEPSVPDGRIRVKNDSQDSEYNVVKVSAQGASFTLSPGESALLPPGSRTIHFSRAYKDFTRRYTVNCPSKLESGISMKLIDVHLNRIAGGCTTVEASH